MPPNLPWKTATTLACLALLLAIPYASPTLARLQLLSPREVDSEMEAEAPIETEAPSFGEAEIATETRERPELSQPTARDLPAALPLLEEEKPPRSLEDPSGTALDAFYAALEKTERKEPSATTRITHFGDSLLVTDWVTGTLRRRFQERFGDGGHGFLLIAAGWPGYFHNDVSHTASAGWKVSRVTGPLTKDRFYGLGGVSFQGRSAGAWARFGTAKSGDFGRRVSRFVVSYLEQPGGGELEIKVNGEIRETIATGGEVSRSATHAIEVEDGEHRFELRVRRPPVRAFGVALEREEPGIVYDSIGILGARMRTLDEHDDEHFGEQLRLRAPHLVVFQYGINESEDGFSFSSERLESAMRRVLDQARAALPESSCLVVGAIDRADRKGGVYVSRKFIPVLVEAQRKAAFGSGCAFFDAYEAMGGRGSMGQWVRRGLGGHDLAHPSSSGAEVLGTWIHRALLEGYGEYRSKGLGG